MKENNNTNILGINISNLKKEELLNKITQDLKSNSQKYIVTPNPEIILKAYLGDDKLFFTLNNANYAIADGFGLKIAALFNRTILHRITGADLSKDILGVAEKQNKKVLLISWTKSLSSPEEIRRVIKEKYPNLSLEIVESNQSGDDLNFTKLQELQADILFINFGAPHQEKFILHNLEKIPSVKLAIGVGGSFDFLTNKIKRAPIFFRSIGSEWLWRLIQEPKRIKRIYNAVITFPLQFINWKYIKPFQYRKNVACILYKKVEQQHKVLIIKRAGYTDHWQIPQGGTDGQSLKIACARELEEEANIDPNSIEIKEVFKNIHKYTFSDKSMRYLVNSRIATGNKGQSQGLVIAKYTGNDQDVKVNPIDHTDWKWVDTCDLAKSVAKQRQASCQLFLEKLNKTIKN